MALFVLVLSVAVLAYTLWLTVEYPNEDIPLVRWVGVVSWLFVWYLVQYVFGIDDMALSGAIA